MYCMSTTDEYYKESGLNIVKPLSHSLIFPVFIILSEELRSEITQDACMCEAQIMFQKKVQSTIQELNRKHILSLLEPCAYKSLL